MEWTLSALMQDRPHTKIILRFANFTIESSNIHNTTTTRQHASEEEGRARGHREHFPRPSGPRRYDLSPAEQWQLTDSTPGELVFGVARIFASFNDTFVHVTDLRSVS